MPRTRPLALGAAALALVALTGCAATSATSDTDATPHGADRSHDGVPVVPAEYGHVHGMAVNPADGLLYLGTHSGTLAVDGRTITHVGESTIDLMGFAAAGPDHFYASGHPGPHDDLPNPVGLIESTDGGRTWQPLSLTGEVDFHALGAAGDQVYGFSGRLVRTSNGTDWTPGAADLAPASIAVDPADGDRVVATTEHGPVLSTDAGQSFTHLEGAPLLLFVAWATPDGLWGVSPEGTVYASADAGRSWDERGDVDAPAAFTAGEDGTVVVATAAEILRSADGGETFEPVAEVADADH